MSKLNFVNKLKNNFKKLLSIVALFCLLAISSQIKTYPHIPLKGLFEVLKKDDIGFGHTLLHSKWIENMYQYGEGKPPCQERYWRPVFKNDEVANLVRKFWFRRSENHQLLPTQFGPFANIPNDQLGNIFGQLINYVYTLRQASLAKVGTQQDERELISELLEYDQLFKQELTAFLRELHEQEYKLEDEKFNLLKQAKKLEQEKREELQKKYKMDELKDEIAQASKEWGKKKGFSKKREEIEKIYDTARYYRALKEASEMAFEGVPKEIKSEYSKTQATIKKIDAAIVKMVKKKKDVIRKALFDPIHQAFMFCQTSKIYVPRTVEAILWALFFHKLEELRSRDEKIKAINDCIGAIDKEFKREEFCNSGELKEFYTQENFEAFKTELAYRHSIWERPTRERVLLNASKQVNKIFGNYDFGLHYLIRGLTSGLFSPVIGQGEYGYEYEPGKCSRTRPDCHETATLDVISLLWYNPKIRAFDDSLFSDDVLKNGKGFKRLLEALKYFYLADVKKIKAREYTCIDGNKKFTSLAKLKTLTEKTSKGGEKLKITPEEVEQLDISQVPVSYITRAEVKQEFMNIVSGLVDQGVIYCSEVKGKGKIFELDSDVRNVLAIFNYFYGLRVEQVEQLGDKQMGLSTEGRTLSFKKQDDEYAPNIITIHVEDNNEISFDMAMHIRGGHTFVSVVGRQNPGSKILIDDVRKIILKKILDKFDPESEVSGEKERWVSIFTTLASPCLLKDETIAWELPISQLIYYASTLKTPEGKMKIIRDILEKHPQYYDSCKGMIYNLVDGIPLNDEHLRKTLSGFIGSLALYEKDSFFQAWIEKCTPVLFLRDITASYSMDWQMLPKVYNDFIEKIEDIHKYQLIKAAIGRDHKEIISLLIKGQDFIIDKDLRFLEDFMLQGFIKHGFEDIATRIVNNPQYKHNRRLIYSALRLAIEKEYTNIALLIVKHPRFYVPEIIGDLLMLLTYKGSQSNETALKNEKCNLEGCALNNKYKEIALAIVSHHTFKADFSAVGYYLLFALKKAIAFESSSSCLSDQNNWYKEIALAIVNNPTFDASLGKTYSLGYGFCYIGQALVLAFQNKGYEEIATRIMENEKFDGWGGALSFALQTLRQAPLAKVGTQQGERCREVATAIIEHPKCNLKNDGKEIGRFDKFKRYGAGKALVLALAQGHKEIVAKIVQDLEFYDWENAMVFALQNERYRSLAVKIPEYLHSIVSENHLKTILELAVSHDQKEVALKVMIHPDFQMTTDIMDSILKLAFEKEYREVILTIVNNEEFVTYIEKFRRCSSGSYFANKLYFRDIIYRAIEKGYQGVVLAIIKNEKLQDYIIEGSVDKRRAKLGCCYNDCPMVLYILTKALEKEYKDIVLAIVNNPQFHIVDTCRKGRIGTCFGCFSIVKGIFELALKKGYKKVVSAIMNHPKSKKVFSDNDLEDALILLAKSPEEYKEIVKKILEDPMSKKKGKILKRTLEFARSCRDVFDYEGEQKYKKIALTIVQHPLFSVPRIRGERWARFSYRHRTEGAALKLALEFGYRDIFVKAMENSTFQANFKGVLSCLKLLLEKQDIELALKIITLETFDANKRWVQKVLDYAKELAEKEPKQAKELQKVIDAIEHTQKEKINKE